MMGKVMRHVLLALMLVAGAVQAQEKFVAAAGTAGGPGLYRVTLELFPGDDVGAVARQLAATYRGRLEMYAEEGFTGFAITMSESAARLLSTDTRVVRVEPLGLAPMPALPAVPQSAFAATPTPAGIADDAPVQSDATGSQLMLGPYTYDGAGNIKSVGTGLSFVYDQFGRLTSGTVKAGRTESYAYDAFGNITSKTTDGAVITMGVDSATNLLTASGTSNVHAQYDLAGNMTSSGALGSFVYDGLGMVKESTIAGTRKLYLYTADDERIATVTPAHDKWEYTVRGADQKVLRRITRSGGSWTWDEDYIYRAGSLLAAEVPGPEKTLHFHLDHLGTPRLITGNGGAEVSRHTYFPFGFEVLPAPPSSERLRFTGHERDTANLDYMHARYYAVGWGRFLSVDPVLDVEEALHEPQLWNRYSYVTNNPLKFTDPDGRYRTFYKEKPMTAENLAMDENTPAVVKGSVYATGGLTAVGAAGFLGAGSLLASAKQGLGAAGTWAITSWDKVQRFAQGVVDFFSPGPSSSPLTSFERASNQLANQLQFTATTLGHMKDAGRMVPRSILAQAIMTGARSADPQGAKGAIQITQNITKNGKDYVLQIIYREKDKTILHFHYATAK